MTQQPWGQQSMQRPAGQPTWVQPQQPWGQPPAGWGQPAASQQSLQGSPSPLPYHGYPSSPAGVSPVKMLLLGVVAALAVGFFAFSLMSFLNDPGEVVGPAPGPTTQAPTPEPPPSPEPVPTPEVGETSAPPAGVPEPDFDPPDLPMPESWDQVDDWLLNNAIYAESVLVPTNCTLSRIDVQAVTPQQLQEHLNTLTGCLMMVWQEPMQRAGFVMPRPPITVYTAPITTACGEISGINASYCPGDQRLYYAANLHEVFQRRNPEVMDNAFLPDYVMGHEFGHAIQGRSGLTGAEFLNEYRSETEEEKLAWSRRLELQADCFAGVFINAVSQASRMTDADHAEILEIAHAIGDDSLTGRPDVVGNHGHGVNRQHWAGTGLASAQAGVCNTFAAPEDQVS